MDEKHTPKRVASHSAPDKKKIALIAGGAAAAVLLGGYLGLCAWAGSSQNIFPGVCVAGVPVGGMNRQDALSLLEENLGQVSGQVTLPLEYGHWTGEITAAAVQVDEQATADQAWKTGRENFILQGASYLAHQLGAEDQVGLTLAWTSSGKSRLEAEMDEADLQVGGALTNATYAVEQDKIMLTKGFTGVTIDREAAESMVMTAMTQAVSSAMEGSASAVQPVVLPAHETTPQEPDFDAMYAELHAVAKSAEIDPETLEISQSVLGVDFDVAQAKAMFAAAAEGETVEIPLTITEPEETTEGLQAKLFRDLLGEGTSKVSGSANRKSNVKLSAQACNGVVLMPGEVFSYNNTTGSRTADKGYLAAPVYSGGASVSGVGGGICQTSSTIYYAVLHTSLEIVERHAHMYAVGYVPDGMDATVWYGGTNEDGRYAVPDNSVFDVVQPTTQYKADSSVPRGTTRVDSVQNAYRGRKAQTYRYIYAKDGTLLEKENLGVSSYKMRPTTILYNPADGDPSKPASKPETPTTQPETPTTQPETPTTQPETPATQPETPTTQPEAPTTQPETPTTQPETPATQPETPAEQPDSSESPSVPESPPSQDIAGA